MNFLLLMTSLAFGGGGGLYVDTGLGPGVSGFTGLHAPYTLHLSSGYYRGNYQGNKRFGVHWKGGLALRATGGGAGEAFYVAMGPELEFGRGVDLINFGAWWTLAAGATYMGRYIDQDDEMTYVWGPSLRGTLGMMYSFGSSVGLAVQLDLNFQFLPDTGSRPLFGGIRVGPMFRTNRLDKDSRERLKAKRREVKAWRKARKERLATP